MTATILHTERQSPRPHPRARCRCGVTKPCVAWGACSLHCYFEAQYLGLPLDGAQPQPVRKP